MKLKATMITLMAALGAGLVGTAYAQQPDISTSEGSQTFLQESVQNMGNPAVIIKTGAFVQRYFGNHTYYVTKFIANNWSMHGTNYGEITMGAVFSPDDN